MRPGASSTLNGVETIYRLGLGGSIVSKPPGEKLRYEWLLQEEAPADEADWFYV